MTFLQPQNLAIIGILIFLEGLLSIDNALVLAIIARGVDPKLQKKVLTYGLVGAIFFRMLAIGAANTLIQYQWVKFLGGAYLLWLAAKYFFINSEEETGSKVKHRSFWMTVLLVELTDIAFAMDSILAAVALTHQYSLIVVGGLIGTFIMRFAAMACIKLLKKYPRLETSAYLLITVIGSKVVLEGFQLNGVDFHSPSNPWFWIQWVSMAFFVVLGFVKRKNTP